jgi:hypothetical protein
MAQFVGFAEGVEVNGETVYAIVDGMGAFKSKALDILARNGIRDPKAGNWYLQQSWLDSFKEIAETLGDNTLLAIGRKIPENAKFPPQINTIEKALLAIDVAYHINHRKGEIGHYHFSSTGPKSAKLVCRNPYPCAFDRGIIEAMAKRFKPKDSMLATVKHDDSCPCRKKGADSCTYTVAW